MIDKDTLNSVQVFKKAYKQIIRKLILLCLILTCTYSLAQVEKYDIFNQHFTFKIQKNDEVVDSRETLVKLYRGEKKILSHILLKEIGDCSSISIEIGDYFIKNNKIFFYSYWATADRMPSSLMPYGFRKQVYTINKNGIVKLQKSEIYIEDFVENKNKNLFEDNSWKHKGIKYLTQKPKNKHEQFLLNDYIHYIEKKYHAKFVNGAKKHALEKEVRIKLKAKIAEHTKDWADTEIYGNSRR